MIRARATSLTAIETSYQSHRKSLYLICIIVRFRVCTTRALAATLARVARHTKTPQPVTTTTGSLGALIIEQPFVLLWVDGQGYRSPVTTTTKKRGGVSLPYPSSRTPTPGRYSVADFPSANGPRPRTATY